MLIRIARHIAPTPLLFIALQTNSHQKDNQTAPTTGSELTQSRQKVELMEDKYQKLNIKGLQQRHITGVDSFQKDIISQNKFDLLDPRIKPKVASLSTTMGLQLSENNQLTEVNLGKIKIKKENQVFLSEVDPNNIPQYYEIVFDYEKEMSLVGKRMEGEQKSKDQAEGEMKISSRRAFEEKTQQQFTKDVFGFGFKVEMSYKVIMKRVLFSILIGYIFTQPFAATQAEVHFCLKSITQIQKQRMKHVQKFKREAFINAIITNPDMQSIS